MDMALSFYYYLLLLNELFKRNKQKEFNKKKKQAKQTNKYKTKIKGLVPSLHFTDPSLVSGPVKIRLR